MYIAILSTRNPISRKKNSLKREHNNEHDKFAVAGRVTMKERLGWITVGHIPTELSRYVWYSIQEGEKYDVEVFHSKYMASPLIQGGLEIPIKLTVKWDSSECMKILNEKSKRSGVPIAGEYKDSSKNILNELGVKVDDDDVSE